MCFNQYYNNDLLLANLCLDTQFSAFDSFSILSCHSHCITLRLYLSKTDFRALTSKYVFVNLILFANTRIELIISVTIHCIKKLQKCQTAHSDTCYTLSNLRTTQKQLSVTTIKWEN